MVLPDGPSLPELSLWAMETLTEFSSIIHSPKYLPEAFSTLIQRKDSKDGVRLFAVDQDKIRLRLDILEKLPPTELFPEVTSIVTFISHTEKYLSPGTVSRKQGRDLGHRT